GAWENPPYWAPDMAEIPTSGTERRSHCSTPGAAETADRNLLFGLLALQHGLIDQDQLLAAFRNCTRDKSKPLANMLVGRGDLDDDDRAAVEVLVARHIKKHGDIERSLAAVPTGRSTRAQLAALGDPQIEASLVHVASGSTERDDR